MNNGLSLEFPVVIKHSGKTDVMGILEFLTATECRFRSLIGFDHREQITLQLTVHGGPRLECSGVVASSSATGARQYHDVALAPMSAEKTELFVGAIAEISRRHSERRTLPEVPATKGLTRSSVRVALHMEVDYSTASARGTGTATNISTGGMLLAAIDKIDVGATLEVRFRLPDTCEMNAVRGRIVAFHTGTGAYQYNIAFFGVEGPVRERISEFVASKAVLPVA